MGDRCNDTSQLRVDKTEAARDGRTGGWTDRHREIRERERKYMCVCVSPCAWTEARKEKRKTLKPQTGIDEAKARGESLR